MQTKAVEPALIERARKGDRRALERLLASEQPRIYAFGLRMCSNEDDAKEVLQDTLLAIARAVPSFRGDAALSTWIFQIARRFCQKRHRRRKGAPARLEALDQAVAVADPRPDPEQQADAKEVSDALGEALRALPAAAREVVVLRDVEGLTAPEVAKTLGISVQAVKSRLHRARAQLLVALEGEAPSSEQDCPDIAAMFSQELEGDLSPAICRKMEQHLSTCKHCRTTCASMQKSLRLCQRLPKVPAPLKKSAKTAVELVTADLSPKAASSRGSRRSRSRP
ncbi:MAG: sigma-70 family RNA polymerase sigma factor [Myxococcota bacterium]